MKGQRQRMELLPPSRIRARRKRQLMDTAPAHHGSSANQETDSGPGAPIRAAENNQVQLFSFMQLLPFFMSFM